MSNTSFVQNSFIGGEWSPWVQGRFDLPKYRMAMNLCLNGVPVEEGAWTRRSGTHMIAPTRSGAAGRVIGWEFEENSPYVVEFTDGHLRFFAGVSLVVGTDAQRIAGINLLSPATVSTVGAHGWSTGDQIEVLFNTTGPTVAGPTLRNRQFLVTVTGTNTFTIADSVTGAAVSVLQGDWPDGTQAQVARIIDLASPWTAGSWETLRLVPVDTLQAVCLVGSVAPQLILATVGTSTYASFTLQAATFIDGPYLDPTVGSIATPSGIGGVITLTLSFEGWSSVINYSIGDFVSFGSTNFVSMKNNNLNVPPFPNGISSGFWALSNSGAPFGPNGAQASDVGRLMRLFYAPAVWNPGSAYVASDNVTFNGAYYTCTTANTGLEPDLYLANWQPNAGVAYWAPAVITSVVSSSVVDVQLVVGLLDTTPITTFQVGLYSPSSGYPTVGCYAGGRLWLAGSQSNRIDASSTTDVLTFSPTGSDGTVADSDAISLVLNSADNETIQWMRPVQGGVLIGTITREYLIRASATQDPITPATADVQPVTKYGSAFVEAREAGLATIFIQRHGLQVMEMVANVFSGRYNAPNLAMVAKHLMTGTIQEIAYIEEPAPIIWARTGDGVLVGCTYRRLNAFQTDNPAVLNEPSTFAAWHHHELGTERIVKSITKTLLPDASLDQLWMTTTLPAGSVYWVEALEPIPQITDTFFDAWFLDGATTPSGVATVAGPLGPGTRFFGYTYLAGQTVSVWACGIDCGTFLVSPTGYVDVPFGSAGGLYTEALVNATSGSSFGSIGTPLDETVTPAPPPGTTSPMTITAYQPDFALNGMADGGDGFVDFGNQRIISIVPSNSATSGIRVYNLSTGETVETTAPQLFGPDSPSSNVIRAPKDGGGTVGADGFYYFVSNSITDHPTYGIAPLQRVDLTTGKIVETFYNSSQPPGAFNAPIENPSGPVGINGHISTMATTMCNGFCYGVVDQPPPSQGNALAVFNFTNMCFAGFSATPAGGNDEELYTFCRGHTGSDYGSMFGVDNWQSTSGVHSFNLYQITIGNGVFALADPVQTNNPAFPRRYIIQHQFTTDQYGTLTTTWASGNFVAGNLAWNFGCPFIATDSTNYEPGYDGLWGWKVIANPNINLRTVATLLPSSWDGTWFGFELVSNLVYDESDANIILLVQGYGGNGGTFLTKLSSYDGHIIWKIGVSLDVAIGDNGVPDMNLANGVLTYIDNGGGAHVFNSITGAALYNFSIPGVTVGVNYQASDSVGGRIIFWGSYDGTTAGAPTPEPGTPPVLANAWFSLTAGNAFQGMGSVTTRFTIPVVIGVTYSSQGQLIRPVLPMDAGTPHGPAQGELRRVVMYSALLSNAQGISFGTDFGHLVLAPLTVFKDGPVIPATQPFSGVLTGTLNSTYDYDGMICWQVSRPYPATIVNVGGFLTTSER